MTPIPRDCPRAVKTECRIDGKWYIYSFCSLQRDPGEVWTSRRTYLGQTNIWRVDGGDKIVSSVSWHHWK